MKKYHIVVTTYDTVKSEYMAYSPPATDASKASSKKKASRDDDDDSESDSFGKAAPKKKGKAAKKCALYGIKWWRVVLGIFPSAFLGGFIDLRASNIDEAHNIKNVKTKGAVACCELQSKFRWCLTGTPMYVDFLSCFERTKLSRGLQAEQCH
jgi:hypothetical protein